LASDFALRKNPVEGSFALTLRSGNIDQLACVNIHAEHAGLTRGMPLADARALCADLVTRPADPASTARSLEMLRRWASRYGPYVASDPDGLIVDITGVAHLFGGEAALRRDLHHRLDRNGLAARSAIADTRGAAYALARHGGTLPDLPVIALRIPEATAGALTRLGLRRVGDLLSMPRAPLARRFGRELVMRLDQLTGMQPEPVSAPRMPVQFSARMTLPEPIGLHADVMTGLMRLLQQLTALLERHQMGARQLRLDLRRVDCATQQVSIGLARPLRDAARIATLFSPKIDSIDAGFGIEGLLLVATSVEPLPPEQIDGQPAAQDAMADLISRLGNRLGFHNIQRIKATDSLIPEKSFTLIPATETVQSRPLPHLPAVIFAPEPIHGDPPQRFYWRGQPMTAMRATGPERIAPDWWDDDPAWALGLRDYWRVQTDQGPRLWLFHTPQAPAWFIQGEFI